MQRQPFGAGVPQSVLIAIDRAFAAGDIVGAAHHAQQALDAGYTAPSLFSVRALGRKNAGQFEAALNDLLRALELGGTTAENFCAIAECLNALGRVRKALLAVQDALARNPSLAAAWYQKAYAHQTLGELAPARDALLNAVRFAPHMVDAQATLANLFADQGAFAAARRHAEAALSLDPANAIAALARASADLADQRLDAAETILLRVLADPHTPPPLRAAATAKLGDVRDAQDKTDEAFAAYRDSRNAWARFYEPQLRGREFGCAQTLRVAAFVAQLPPAARLGV